MADREELVSQFVNVTGVEASRARFYLDSAAWDVELAIASFFEGGADNEEEVEMPSEPSSAQDVSMPTEPRNESTRFGTIRGLNVESDSSEEEGQAYYAGGSDRSGQQVLGPPKKKKDSNKLVDALFKSAREHGAEEKQEEDRPRSSHAAFVGSGYRLGETSDDTTVVQGARSSDVPRQVNKKLKLWKNGFSVDDGPLRDYNDPNNKQFLDSIARSEVPQELVREARGGEVNLDMEDHRTDDYVKPKVTVRAFSGHGHMLGSDEPPTFSPAPTVAVSQPVAGDLPPPAIDVDSSKPTTSVQLRLADGKRLVLKLNHSHKISDIRQHIVTSNPEYARASFCLMTTFPNKELSDESQTLEEAKLLNAVIVQRMK